VTERYDAVGGIVNDNRGRDLQDVDAPGRSAISATAKYPGQPAFPAMASATITKTVGNEFDKTVRVMRLSWAVKSVKVKLAK
jgi:hypothetical protein